MAVDVYSSCYGLYRGQIRLPCMLHLRGSGSETLSLLQIKNNRSPFDWVEEGCDIKKHNTEKALNHF